ncbi:MAG: glutamine synthetase family protein [Prevotellaceae bacterium]|nr:glutamine synthetase family protein [Prevotellaceae bacterium]
MDSICLNPLVRHLHKSPEEFTREDIISFIVQNGIEMLDFHYVGGDGRLKTLSFVISDEQYLRQILTFGERVDGSSLFSFVEAGKSDLYVIPRFRTAFVDTLAKQPTLCLLCSYYTKDGMPLEVAPEYVLKKAAQSFRKSTGMEFQAMGELEFYVIGDRTPLFQATDQHGYHESSPFAKFGEFRSEAMFHIAQARGKIKYGHSEVGNFTLDGKIYEQNEIEFLVTNVEDAANQLVIAKWIIRRLACKYGLDVTFAPKITTGKAGSGLHIHTRVMKNESSNAYVSNGSLSDIARTVIAGYMQCAPSLTAFGNVNPTSYLRLVPHQEAPTTVCWGDRNRSVLVRVPLGWRTRQNMVAMENPVEESCPIDGSIKQTIEFRCPDGSANIHLLMAGLTVAARTGFEMDDALDCAARTYVDVNIFQEEHQARLATLNSLPACCVESAEMLNRQREIYERDGVFAPRMIDGIIADLRAFDDKNLRQNLLVHPAELTKLIEKYYHCG